MWRVSEDLLMAYADGALSGEEAGRVEALLERDAKARERVRLYRETAALARAAFNDVLEEPVPERLVEAARGRGRGRIVAFPEERVRRWALPLAAGIALVIGIGFGSHLSSVQGPSRLAEVLEKVPSGRERDGVVPLATYRRADGGWCRQFERREAETRTSGIACRQGDGDWRIVALVPEPTFESGDLYAPAGGPEDLAGELVARLALEPVSEAAEARLVARRWSGDGE